MPEPPDDRVVFDEVLVTFLVPRGLSATDATRVHRALHRPTFLNRVRRSVVTVLSRPPVLASVTVVVSR